MCAKRRRGKDMSRTSYLRRPLAALLKGAALAASVVIAVVVLASPAWAATYTVTNNADSGAGSLRQAIVDANTTTGVADTINFNLGSSATITLTSAQLPDITDGAGLTIDGGSADITISGANQYRVFEVGSGAKLTLSNLTVADGAAAETDPYLGRGGGINNNGGTVTVSNSTLSGNSASFGHAAGGGIYNGGTLEVSNSTLSGNSSGNSAPGGGAPGGGIYNAGTATVSNSTLSGNSAIYDGGGIFNSGTLEVSNSTLSGNSAAGGGGGINNDSDFGGTATVSNSTLSGNSASFGGGIIMFSGTLEVSNSTLSGNSGGAYLSGGATATFKNTIVANSPSENGNCWSIPNDGGYNLDSDNTCGFSTNNNSLSGVDPMLGPLADNGGPTQTHALLEGSPAIDKGNSFGESTDQRGLVRPSNFVGIPDASGGDGSDIGAFELQAPDTTPPKVTSTVPGNGGEVGPAVNVKATFSEKMDTNTINGQTFKLFKKGSTTQIAAQVSYSVSTRTAKLDPTNNLRRGVTYKAVVTTGAKDLAGNQLDQNTKTTGLQQKVWYFTVDN
jgi:Bacterial Ig-like domain